MGNGRGMPNPYHARVYELTVQTEFCAAHAIWIRGEREPLHGHNWRVTLVVAGPELDEDGLLCDFHVVERALAEVVGSWRDRSLNDVAPFAPDGRGLNPTAEHVAREIAERVTVAARSALAGRGFVASASVTEAPGCVATFRAPSVGPAGRKA